MNVNFKGGKVVVEIDPREIKDVVEFIDMLKGLLGGAK